MEQSKDNFLGEAIKWWKEAVVYQIYPKSFCDSNSDGIGDIKGIISKLDYLKYLGINVIWISPMYKSPMADNGYDISDYYQIDEKFGTMEDMDNLIKQAKLRNIKIIMDLVVNHSSDEHIWFKKAIKDLNSKYADYYIIKDGINNNPPTNWRSIFGGSVWEKIENTNKYYLHVFAKKQPDLNWENAELREEIYKMINFWLDKGLGGFRIDAITYIKKDSEFKSLPADGIDGLSNVDKSCLNQSGIEVFLKELKTKTFDKYDCMTVAEAPGVPYNNLDKFISDDGFFSMIFDFSYADLDLNENGEWYKQADWTVNQLRELIFKSQTEVQKVGWGALYLENHDQPRSINKYVPEQDISYYSKTMLATMYFMLRGTPFIYQGQEIGMENCIMDNINEFDDISTYGQYEMALKEGLNQRDALKLVNKRSRDNARTPFQWNNDNNCGFTDSKPWIKINNNYKVINAKSQIDNPNSVFSFYKELISIRKNSIYSDILIYGYIEPCLTEYDNIIAYKRTLNNKSLLIINNFNSKNISIKLETDIKNIILNNYTNFRNDTICDFQPYQSVIIEI